MLVVGTWNLENFFRPGATDGPTSQAAYDDKLAHLTATINAIGPDVLAVQEVGQPEALDDLANNLGPNWHAVTSDHPDGRGIRVGFLSTLAFTDVEHVVAFPDKLKAIQQDDGGPPEHEMGRGALRVRVTHGGDPVDLVSCHLKSKLLSFKRANGSTSFQPKDEGERARVGAYALYRRAAEAATVRSYVNGLLAGQNTARVVVLGDMNDEPNAATTQMLLGPPGSQFATGGFNTPDAGDATRLWSLAPLIPEAERYSRIFEGHRELIDHILVSHALADKDMDVTIHHQADESIGVNPAARRDKPASDHDPVVAHLTAA